jgi:hypothetical protein
MAENSEPVDRPAQNGDAATGSPNRWDRLIDIGQVAAPAAALIAALGGLAAATGLEEVQRNHAVLFVLALVSATFSAILVAVAGLVPAARTPFRVLATALAVVAVLGGLALVVASASESQRPLISPSVEIEPATKTLLVSATVDVEHVPNKRRLVVVVDGLNPTKPEDIPKTANDEAPGDFYAPDTVYQAYVGADDTGKIRLPVAVRIPLNKYEAVGIKAYTGQQGDAAGDLATVCERYPRRVSTYKERRAGVGPGCVVLRLPATSR